MAGKIVWLKYAIEKKLRKKAITEVKYSKRTMLGREEASLEMTKKLQDGTPFMAGRFGFFELAVMRMYEFNHKKKYDVVMENVYNCAGFFPKDTSLGHDFTNVMTSSLRKCDYLACSGEFCENYFMNKYMPEASKGIYYFDVFNICELENSWTKALKGKKVLVVSPFSKTVETQYKKRHKLFINKDNPEGEESNPESLEYKLPEFELLTYQSLLTVGDLKDDRFNNWFEALDFMASEIMKMDFDVALLGCGAYGFPLAAKIKESGRTAIHMGGTTQLVFGIMGRRWDGSRFGGIEMMPEKIARYYNEYWTYPLEEKPKEAGKVEYGPYWK